MLRRCNPTPEHLEEVVGLGGTGLVFVCGLGHRLANHCETQRQSRQESYKKPMTTAGMLECVHKYMCASLTHMHSLSCYLSH